MRRNWGRKILGCLVLIGIGFMVLTSLNNQKKLEEHKNNVYSAFCKVTEVYSNNYLEINCEIVDKGTYTNVYKNQGNIGFKLYWDTSFFQLIGYNSIDDIQKGDDILIAFNIENVEDSVIRIINSIVKE
jgi:hypothetical protein